jgi:hypothetical protein
VGLGLTITHFMRLRRLEHLAEDCHWIRPASLMRRSPHAEEIAIVGTQAREARELALAAEAAGLAVRPLAFGSPLADAALAAHGPGSVHLPLAIVGGRYSLQRPALDTVLECIEVLRRTRHTLPAACVVLASTAELGDRGQSGMAE